MNWDFGMLILAKEKNRADLNNNAVASKEESLNGFSMNTTILAALKTEQHHA